jgi:hypothetical protein
LHPRRAHLALLAVLVAVISCGSDETAILLEVVPGTVDPLSLDEVLFRVTGKGLDGGEGIARAPLHGSGATPFPLSLALRGRAPAAGPFTVDVEGRGGGVLRATASAGAPIAFENGTVVHQRLILHALDEPGTSPDAAAEPGTDRQDAAAATAVDAASGAAADSMMPAPSSGGGQGGGGSHGTGGTAGNDGSGPPSGAGPDGSMGTGGGGAGAGGGGTGGDPAPGMGGGAGGGSPSGAGGAPGAGAGSCGGCDKMCVTATATGCAPAPDGTACRGQSGMVCQRCQCGKPPAGGGDPGGGDGCAGCDKMCTVIDGSTCRPAPDGTRCRGNSGMTCQACRCGK